jgi:hypothetical protein
MNVQRFIFELVTRIDKHVENETNILTIAPGASSYDDYKKKLGTIEGLRLALIIARDVEDDIRKDEANENTERRKF